MRNSLILLPFILLLAGCSGNMKTSGSMDSTSQNASNNAGSDGWISLFDGKTTQGWHGYGGIATPIWEVRDGSLFLNVANKKAKGDQYLISDEEYDNFHLKLDWKVAPKGNSGIIFYVNEDKTRLKDPTNKGHENQVLD